MSLWVMNIVGMVFVGVMLDVVMPSGKTNAFIKGVFAIFILYVIVSPLPQLLNLESVFKNENATKVDTNYLINVNLQQVSSLEDDIIDELNNNGYHNVAVIINANIYDVALKVQKVYLDLAQMVLNKDVENININNDMKNIVIKMTGVNEEDIVIYG